MDVRMQSADRRSKHRSAWRGPFFLHPCKNGHSSHPVSQIAQEGLSAARGEDFVLQKKKTEDYQIRTVLFYR